VHILPKEDSLLGPYYFRGGDKVDPEKIESIRGCPTPKNVTEVRSFMGLAGYYRRFIKGFQILQTQLLLCKRRV
jgi:hypothetical protein